MRHTTALGALLALLSVGCTDMVSRPATTAGPTDETAASVPAEDGAAPTPAGHAADGAPPNTAGQLDDAAPIEVPTPALLRTQPLAQTSHPLTEHGGALEIELRAERLGELLRVAVTFTPRGIDPGRVPLTILLGGEGVSETVTARLVDPVNLLEYETVHPAVAPATVAPTSVDHPTTLMFYFGAPTAPMETADFLLDLSLSAPAWPGFLDVPFGSI